MNLLIAFLLSFASAQNLPPGHPPLSSDSPAPNESAAAFNAAPVDAEQALFDLKASAEPIDGAALADIQTQHNGRIKPLQTLARESLLFVTGRYSLASLEPVSMFFALSLSTSAPFVNLIEIRDPDLRVQLGFLKTQRHVSLADLEKSPLAQMAQPIMEKEKRNSRAVSPGEKAVLELFNQASLARSIIDGSLFLQSIDFKPLTDPEHRPSAANDPIIQAGQDFFKGLAQGQPAGDLAAILKPIVAAQPVPDMMKWQPETMAREVFYNNTRPFFWTAILLFVIGSVLAVPNLVQFLSHGTVTALLLVPLILIAFGLGVRVSITGFAPVTNMYGTMIWVAFGTLAFSLLLFVLYKNRILVGLLSLASALTLFLTESVPLVLSPDLDPIVAVLRSNYWLTIHVLTITISYAAFTIAMVLGNSALIRVLLFSPAQNQNFFKTYAHYTYRMIQLGVFLLTAGIILGGIWADYSWGRFWGWDPKETWALIADVGFLAILHARYTGWLGAFGTLAASPIAYLLVIMAWYGVNFILAAGLHSYGFSSGGALAVGVFVGLQILLLIVALAKHFNIWDELKLQKTGPK